MSSTIVARVKQRQIAQLISRGKRLDGRGLTDYREVQLEMGVIERAEGQITTLESKVKDLEA